jgi:hypothetical protein
MNQHVKSFLTFFAAIAILLPSLGFKVVKHTCLTCNTVEFHLFDSGNCSGCEEFSENEAESSCCNGGNTAASCGIEGVETVCCLFEVAEPDVDNYIVPSVTMDEIQSKPIDILFVSVELENTDENSFQFLKYNDPPSPSLSGIDFLFFINQLKIPIC